MRSTLVIGLLVACAPRAIAEEDLGARIDRVMAKHVREDGPGAAVAVIREGRVACVRACGMADIDETEEMTADRVFDLASVSKNLTAYGVMLLADRGKVSLEADVRDYLPEIKCAAKARPIRVVDVLHMVSGIASYQDLVDDYDGVTNEGIVGIVGAAPLAFPTGSKYEYSNTDYNLLATLCTRVSGMRFGDFMKKEVFDPLGMTRTAVLERKGQAIPGRVKGYKAREGGWVVDCDDTPGIVGDGSVFSCVGDLARYDAALRDGALVSSVMLRKAWTSGETDGGQKTGYGFGWEVEDDGDGGLLVEHNGSWNGTSTYFGRWVDKDYSIILLFNSADADWGDASQGISEAVEAEE